MKKTTLILITMVLAGFIVMLAAAAMAWFFREPAASQHWVMGKERTSIEIPTCRVLQFDHPHFSTHRSGQGAKAHIVFENGGLNVVPTTASTGEFSFPADLKSLLSTRMVGDTCFIELSLSEEVCQKYMRRGYQTMLMSIGSMELQLPASVQQLTIDWNYLASNLQGLQGDSLVLEGNGSFDINRCQFGTLSLKAERVNLHSGSLKNLSVDLDRVYRWYVNADSCHVGVEHLTGSRHHHCLLQKGESDELRWTPKTKDASLQLKVEEAVVLKAVRDK